MEREVLEQLLGALKSAYQTMGDVTSLDEYTRVIEPLLSGVGEDERRQLGEALWTERDLQEDSSDAGLYAYTGLAFHLSPLVGGS